MLSKKAAYEWRVLLFFKFNVFAMCCVEDVSDFTWAHAVNSRDALEKGLHSPVDFLEADVTLGNIIGDYKDTLLIPVMAHPPNTSSDLSLDAWLDLVFAQSPPKGIKIDFKSTEVVEPALLVLQKHALQLNSSLWLNADILPGPINSLVNPVDSLQFLAKCQQYFPKATLSIGWTTLFTNGTLPDLWHYEWKHVRKMVDVIRCGGYENNYPTITFPVRAIFASRSLKLFQWLLDAIPGSSLTVWSSNNDPLELTDLVRIRSSFPKQSVFYDIPGELHGLFQEKKNSIKILSYKKATTADDQWMILTSGHDDDCSSITYINNGIILFGRSLTTAVLQKGLLVVENDSNLSIEGHFTFFENTDETTSYTGMQELMLLLVDVGLLSKNVSPDKKLDLTSVDPEILWSAMNSSVISTFQHVYINKAPLRSTFKLDIITDSFFEVSTIHYTSDEKSFGEIAERDKPPDVRIRRILPDGPFLFGLISRGDEHAVVHDLSINGQKTSSLISGSSTICTFFATFLSFCSILCSWLPFCL